MIYLMFGIQITGILAIFISFCAICAGFTLLKKKRENDSEDDLGYLENIYYDMGGENDEKEVS